METIIKKHFKSLIKDNKNLYISIFSNGDHATFAPLKAKYELTGKLKAKHQWNKVSVEDSSLVLDLEGSVISIYSLAAAKKIEIKKNEDGIRLLDITL